MFEKQRDHKVIQKYKKRYKHFNSVNGDRKNNKHKIDVFKRPFVSLIR